MHSALWLLIRLQMRGWVRYLGRSVRTVKGALLVVVGLIVFVPFLFLVLLAPAREVGGFNPEGVRCLGPVLLLSYCLLNVLTSAGERAIYFSPAEINFLFPGPFTRRQLLGYKILMTLAVGLPTTLLMALMIRVRGTWFLASYLSLLLMITFLQLFSMAIMLLASAVGSHLASRGRQLALAITLVLGGLVLVQAGVLEGGCTFQELAERTRHTRTWQIVSRPLGWFFELMLAQDVWTLVRYTVLGLAVNLALVGVVFALDAQYLEAAAASSARLYARIQRLRGRSVEGPDVPPASRARLGIPSMPWWGGIGPIVWRQATAALRGSARLLLILGILGAVLVVPLLASKPNGGADQEAIPILFGLVVWLTIFLTALVSFDFRGDIDRIGALKTLPIPAWRIVLGQLLIPVLLLSFIHWLALGIIALLHGPSAQGAALAALFVVPINFVLIALENLLFLLFPVRLMASTPGDFQAVGRNVLLMFGKMIGLVLVCLAAFLVGLVTWLVTRDLWWSALLAWPVVALSGALLVPLTTWAFRVFDVGRDTPA
jgi:hypothetical protein